MHMVPRKLCGSKYPSRLGERVTELPRRGTCQRYTRLYYRLSTEAVAIVMLNPMLVLRSREVMERYMPVVQSMVSGEQVTLTEGDIEEIDSFLRSFGEKGGPEFQETSKGLREDLHDPH